MKFFYRRDTMFPSTIYYWQSHDYAYGCNESWRDYSFCFGFNHE